MTGGRASAAAAKFGRACEDTWQAIASDVLAINPNLSADEVGDGILDMVEVHGNMDAETLAWYRAADYEELEAVVGTVNL